MSQEVLVALRELFSTHPEAMRCGPETLAGLLRLCGLLSHRPPTFAVEAALEALEVEGEVAA